MPTRAQSQNNARNEEIRKYEDQAKSNLEQLEPNRRIGNDGNFMQHVILKPK